MAMLGDGKNHHMLEDVDSETGRPKTTTTAALNDPDAAAFEEHRNQYLRIFRKLRSEHPDAPIDEVERLAAEKMLEKGKKSRAFYRIQVRLINQSMTMLHKYLGNTKISRCRRYYFQIKSSVEVTRSSIESRFGSDGCISIENVSWCYC